MDASKPEHITLTVMPDYGFAPFLWIKHGGLRAGVGMNCCSAGAACGEHPMSAELMADFTAWMREFSTAPTLAADSAALDLD